MHRASLANLLSLLDEVQSMFYEIVYSEIIFNYASVSRLEFFVWAKQTVTVMGR